MTFWKRFRQIVLRRKYKSVLTEEESLRRDLRWGKARLAIRRMPEYSILREWLDEIIFIQYEHMEDGSSNEKVSPHISTAKTVDFILSKIESSTPEQIEIDEKNLKALRGK